MIQYTHIHALEDLIRVWIIKGKETDLTRQNAVGYVGGMRAVESPPRFISATYTNF